ncbi:DMT family transporter [Streptomyces sp. HMX87]|uniref:DMT family transporter n=1 Tax=Streptomyces sp. HMX87 TaxID=3390849 RepID=UPI003A8AE14C
MIITVLAALAAGACFAVAGVLQQRVASARPDRERLSWRLLWHLARHPVWLSGIALAVLAYGFQSLALAFGPLSLVQPLIVCELVFAVPLAAHLRGVRLGPREWLGTLAVAAGLAAALVTARPTGGDPASARVGAWLLAVGATVLVVAAAMVLRLVVTGVGRASCTALAGGTVMGFQSVLLDATVDRMSRGPVALASAWQTYALVAVSVGGLLLIQSAFQEGPLAATVTVIDTVEPAVAVAVGTTLFGETLHLGWPVGALTALGVAGTVFGIVCLDTSPAIAALHRGDAGYPPTGSRAPDGRTRPGALGPHGQ